MAKKKKNKQSATFKSFLIVIIALFIIWGAVELNGRFGAFRSDGLAKLTIINNDSSLNNTSTAEISTTQAPTNTSVIEPKKSASAESATQSKEFTSTTDTSENATNKTTKSSDFSDIDPSKYSNKTISWSFKRNSTHEPVIGYNEGVDIESFDAHYIGDSSKKRIYLTFDEGYENGYTSMILDTLSKNEVKAAFFVTKAYVDDAPELVKRMKDEGHIVANHSATHPDMTSKTDEEFYEELESTRVAMEKASGYKMDMYFRPPEGKFSERTLNMTRELGYTTIFWSMAYQDWIVDKQPGKDAAYGHVMNNIHPGALILLHAVSKSNAEALDDIIKGLKADGYSFGNISEIKN